MIDNPISKCEYNKKSSVYQTSDSDINLNFFYGKSALRIDGWEDTDEGVLRIYASSPDQGGSCPYCGFHSEKVHSRYMRYLADLPAFGNKVVVCFSARKFFCHNMQCRYKTFAEQPGCEVFRYRRRTRRCEVAVYRHALWSSSIQSSRFLKTIGIQVSKSTVLRDLHRMSIPDSGNVTHVGVDDWAFKKGIDYGTIIIDLSSGLPIDLLGTRDEKDFSEWLEDHCEVKVLSRDRSTEYSHAVAKSGLDVTEVADRFHLMKNLGDCVTDVISSRYDEVSKYLKRGVEKKELEAGRVPTKPKQYVNEVKFNEVKRLQKEGKGVAETSDILGIARQTVRKYRKLEAFPVPKKKPRHPYHLYEDFVEKEYQRGQSLDAIRLALQEKGLKASRTPFHDHFRYLSDGHKGYRSAEQKAMMERQAESSGKEAPTIALPPVRQLSLIVSKSILDKDLSDDECELMNELFTLEWFDELHEAGSSFRKCMRGKRPSCLDKWLDKYEKSSIARLVTLVKGIRLDLQAVKNSIIYNVSNGVVEGFVNKLKTVKRIMYGKAKLGLLRIKMIMPSWIFN